MNQDSGIFIQLVSLLPIILGVGALGLIIYLLIKGIKNISSLNKTVEKLTKHFEKDKISGDVNKEDGKS